MKYLQDLVPGCNKIIGKAGMLDEIINYVQSLQRQVEVNLLFVVCSFCFSFILLNNLTSSPYLYVLLFGFYLKQFLSMKLAAVNPRIDFDVDDFIAKEVNTKP